MKKKLGPFTFIIDRPKGTVKEWPGGKKFTYPCDYGYWPKIKGEDGEGLDAFVGDDEAGHLESFQKLHPDGTPDETKFLLGVDDKQRETIYGLYKNEVNARRVYRDWEEVEGAIEKFQTKMHKTSAHAHKWSVGYLPGYGYRRCACGEVEDVDPDGKTRPASVKDKASVTRWHEKSSAYHFGEKLAAATPEQVERAKALLKDPKFVWHGTNSASDGAATGKIRYGGGLDVYGKGVYLASQPEADYWQGAGYAVPRDHLSPGHVELSSMGGNKWQVDPKDVPLRSGAVAFVHPGRYDEALERFAPHGVDVLPLDALHQAKGGKGSVLPQGGEPFKPAGPAKVQSTQSKVTDYLPHAVSALNLGTSVLKDYKNSKEDGDVLPYRRGAYRVSPATIGALAGTALGYGLGRAAPNSNPLRHVFGLRAPAYAGLLGNIAGMGIGSHLDNKVERGHVFRQMEEARDARSRGEDKVLKKTKSVLSDPENFRGTANVALTGKDDPDLNVIDTDAKALAKSLKNPERDVGFFERAQAPTDNFYRDWVRAGRPAGKDWGMYFGGEKSAAYRLGVKLAMGLDWVPTSIGGRVQTPSQIVQSSWSTPALAGTQENIKLLQLAQDPYSAGTPVAPVHHRHRRHHG